MEPVAERGITRMFAVAEGNFLLVSQLELEGS
jgi:hypothetical protein